MKSTEKKTKRTTYFIAGFLIVSAFILSTGYLYYRYAIKSFRVQIDQELSAIADMKVKEIIQWREERLGDVSVFYKNDLFSSLVQHYFEKPDDAETLKRIQIWLEKVQKHYNYEKVFLMDSNGIERFSIPKATTPISSVISHQHSKIMKSKQIIFGDFYRNEHDHKIYLAVLTPIIDAQDSSRVLGILGLQIDPEHYLYPLLSSWPTPSKTSETLILRREGDEVVFLNSLKFKKDAGLNLRMPMNGKLAIPAIRAALGQEGIVEALDYRGVPVIAEIRTIHGSPWFMVARMDQTEAYAPLKERLSLLTIPVSAMLIGIGIGFILLWKLQRMRFYREKFETSKKLQESEKQFRLLFDTIPDAIFIHDLEGRFYQVNKAACERLGYSNEELLKMTVKDIDTAEFAEKYDESIKSFIEIGQGVLETEHIRRDGSIILTELSSCIIEFAGKTAVLSVARDITQRKQKEEQLNIQSTALNAAANAIVITNISGQIEWVNPAFTKLTGYTLEEVTGENPRTIKSGKHDAAFYMNLWDTILAGKVWHGEMINKRKDESEYTEEMTITPLKDVNGEIIRFIAIKQDITERKQIAVQLNEQKIVVEFILDQTIAGYWDWDIPSGKLFMSPAFKKMFGYEDNELPNIISTLQEIMFTEDFPGMMELFQQHSTSRGQVPYNSEVRYLHKDGSIKWIICSGKIISWGEDGKPLRAVGSHVDITERKQAEEEIHKLQQQIDYIFGATKTGLQIVDIDFNLNYVSPGLQEIYGNYSGKKCYEYFRASGEECEECIVRKAIETESSMSFETTFPLENNRPVQATIIPFKNIDGKWLAAEVTVDITERKKFEEEILIAKAEAEQANIAKSEFLSRMSHELRTPMNSILGFAQLMNMGELKPAHKKGVDHILNSGKHLLCLINEVLDLSRIEAGKLSISLEPVQLRGIILETMDIVRPLAAERNLTIQLLDSSDHYLFTEADRQGLKQVLLNLTSNAVKYNRDGGKVLVKCELMHPENKPIVRISITDTGIGIAPESVTKLFSPFERFGADKTDTEGTGLGLAIAKKMIEAMDGKIGVESEVGIGSTFWIELPLIEGRPDLSERLTEQVVPEQEKAVASGTILYIEDNISNVQLVEQILEAHRPSFRLITEMYGKNAVKHATDYKPDLILLDLDLPDIHGREVLKLLQADAITKSIPVVILSANAMGHSVEQLMKAGAKNYLTKPLDVLEFLRVVDEVMGKKH